MVAHTSQVGAPSSHLGEDDRLYNHLSALAALAAFPSTDLPLDLAVAVAAAADTAKERISTILPRYCGFGIGDVVEVAAVTTGPNTARVEGVCLNGVGTASILLQPISAGGGPVASVQLPLFYAKTGLSALRPSCA